MASRKFKFTAETHSDSWFRPLVMHLYMKSSSNLVNLYDQPTAKLAKLLWGNILTWLCQTDVRDILAPQHHPMIIHGSAVERAKSTKFLGVLLTDNLATSSNAVAIVKRGQQRLHPLQKLRRGTIESRCMVTYHSWRKETIKQDCENNWNDHRSHVSATKHFLDFSSCFFLTLWLLLTMTFYLFLVLILFGYLLLTCTVLCSFDFWGARYLVCLMYGSAKWKWQSNLIWIWIWDKLFNYRERRKLLWKYVQLPKSQPF